jgi:two-component system, cell cycle sensor histidine kinase and response regulator CckA
VTADSNEPPPDRADRGADWALDDPASLRRVLEQLRDIVAVLDADHRIGYASPAVEAALGYPPAEWLGRSILDFVHPADHVRILALLQAETPPGEAASGEGRVRQRDGAWRILEASVTALVGPSGRPRRLLMARDVTERRSLELQLQQAQKAETMGNLATGIAHDFNNVLTAIVGWSDSLLKTLPASDPARAYAHEIRDASQHAAELATHLLAFRRQGQVERTLLNLNDVILRAASLFRRLLGPRIECVLRLTPGVGLVEADQTQIEQVLLNLALNARDAMPDGGTLTIETGAVQLGAADVPGCEPGSYIRLTVRDSGAGIRPETGPRIFEPFFTTKAEGEGTGLGLAIVRWIVDQHRGGILVQSTPGAGATFLVYIPRVEEGEPESERPSLSRTTSPGGSSGFGAASSSAGLSRGAGQP